MNRNIHSQEGGGLWLVLFAMRITANSPQAKARKSMAIYESIVLGHARGDKKKTKTKLTGSEFVWSVS